MRIVIAGGGRVGSSLAARLVGEHAVTVIDRDPAVCRRLFDELGVVSVCGDATEPRVLDEAGISVAEIAAGVLARDADNLAFATVSRAVSSARLMVRMLDESFRPAYRLAGVRDLISEAEVVVGKIASAIEFPQVVDVMPLPIGDAILFELPITTSSAVAGKTVAEVRGGSEFPRECIFIGLIEPEGTVELPSGSTLIRGGQTAILVARRAQMASAITCLTRQATRAEAIPAEALQKIDIFARLSQEELETLVRGVDLLRKSAGETIFKAGEPGDAFYVVISGEVSLVTDNGEVLEVVRPGSFFGEVALLTGETRLTSAVARAATELAAIGRDDFTRLLMANPGVALEMSRMLGHRLATASKGRPKKRALFGR